MSVIVEKCLSCGSPLEYDVDTQQWICEYCKKEYHIEDLNEKEFSQTNPLESYHCPNCGADILCDKDTITSNCLYCDSPVIIQDRISGDFRPNFIIPFEHSKEEIKKAFKNAYFNGRLTEPQYFKEENIVSIEGMYVPYWLVNSEVSVNLEGRQEKSKRNIIYFKRRGSITFKRVPAVAKTTLEKERFRELQPFDYSKLQPFHYAYLSGVYAEKYDASKDEIYEQEVKKRLEDVSFSEMLAYGTVYPENAIRKKVINIFWTKFEYVLVPIWILKVNYNGKIYTNYMNDQNFYMGGEAPVAQPKKIYKIVQYMLEVFTIFFLLLDNKVMMIVFMILLLFVTFSNRSIRKRDTDKDYISGSIIMIENTELPLK